MIVTELFNILLQARNHVYPWHRIEYASKFVDVTEALAEPLRVHYVRGVIGSNINALKVTEEIREELQGHLTNISNDELLKMYNTIKASVEIGSKGVKRLDDRCEDYKTRLANAKSSKERAKIKKEIVSFVRKWEKLTGDVLL